MTAGGNVAALSPSTRTSCSGSIFCLIAACGLLVGGGCRGPVHPSPTSAAASASADSASQPPDLGIRMHVVLPREHRFERDGGAFGSHGEDDHHGPAGGNWMPDAGPEPCLRGGSRCQGVPVFSLEPCAVGTTAYSIPDVLREQAALAGTRIRVFSMLRKAQVWVNPFMACNRAGAGGRDGECCVPELTRLELRDLEGPSIGILASSHGADELYRCDGDYTMTCCKLGVVGETVVATGVLRVKGTGAIQGPYLEGATLCLPVDR